jgi:Deoxyribonuclease NucA/NucB
MDGVVATHTPEHLAATAALLFVLLLALGWMLGGLRLSGGGAGVLPIPSSLVGGRLVRRALAALLILLGLLLASEALDRSRDLPVFVVYQERTPAIADHVRDAQAAGHPSVLTRASAAQRARNRRASGCTRWPGPDSCDEYPFASSQQGGRGASLRGVPREEQHKQGGDLIAFYSKHRLRQGDPFVVVVE